MVYVKSGRDLGNAHATVSYRANSLISIVIPIAQLDYKPFRDQPRYELMWGAKEDVGTFKMEFVWTGENTAREDGGYLLCDNIVPEIWPNDIGLSSDKCLVHSEPNALYVTTPPKLWGLFPSV